MEKHALQWTGERFLPWFSHIQPDIALEHLSRYFAARTFCKDKAVLDVACGEGYGSKILSEAPASVLGVDISEEAVRNAKKRYTSTRLKFAVQDAVQLEQLGRRFDVITAFEMIEHILEQEQFMIQVKKVLKERGIFMVSTPNKCVHETEWHTHNEFHVKELYFDQFQELLQKHFRYCYFYAQRVYRASECWLLSENRSICHPVIQNLVRFDESKAVELGGEDRSPGYYICICSDAPIEHISEKYFLTDVSDRFKNNLEQENAILKNPDYHYTNQYTIYYDYGDGFSEDNKDSFDYRYSDHFDQMLIRVTLPEHVKQIRIDPVEQRFCMIKNLQIEGYPKDRITCNHTQAFDDLLVFAGNKDPQMVMQTAYTTVREIMISYEILVYESAGLWNLLFEKWKGSEKQASAKYAGLEREKEKYECKVQKLSEKNQSLVHEVQKLSGYRKKTEIQMQEFSDCIQSADFQIQELKARESDLRTDVSRLLQDISDIYASASWKFSMPVRAAGMSIRWLARHVHAVHKCATAVHILKNGGIKLLLHELRHYKEHKTYVQQQEHPQDLSVDSKYEENIDFSDQTTDVKLLAFYLPQFHIFPENEAWWGKDFTEWTNVKSGTPGFEGHYQPRVPHADFGYYDLTDIQVLKKQAELASQHGIYGFCFYYYWFSGKRLMEKPLDLLLAHPEIKLRYCLCWANENWTRAWDGQNRDILITQNYSDADDHNFITDLKKYMDDPRYIRIYGKPLILVYNPGQIPNCQKSFRLWRQTAEELGIGEILIWTCQTANHTARQLQIENCIDAEVEFPPHNMWWESAAVRGVELGGKSAFLYSYPKVAQEVVRRFGTDKQTIPVHHGCMLAWDNAARRKDGWFTYCGFSLKSLYQWMLAAAEDARKNFEPEERVVFINAWNEWGEGTYLEPDETYGYASINTVSKAVMGLPFSEHLKVIHSRDAALEKSAFEKAAFEKTAFEKTSFEKAACKKAVSGIGTASQIAVQIHLFYLDTLDEIIANLNQIPYAYDCFVSTDTEKKRMTIEKRMKETCSCSRLYVELYENRGRDVAPFLLQMKDRICQYDYICHIHSKKTKTNDHGNEWRKYNFEHLFGSSSYLKRVFYLFASNPKLGIIMPPTYPVLELQAEWGGNQEGTKTLLQKLGVYTKLPKEPVFPVGNMFWARTDAVQKMFSCGFTQEDFPAEAGQVNATLAHQIERAWVYLAQSEGYSYQKVFNHCQDTDNHTKSLQKKKRLLAYVHYDKDHRLSEDDLKTLEIFSGICTQVLFVTNSALCQKDLDKAAVYADHMLVRKNVGYDFGAWKDVLFDYGREKAEQFDELILLNNSCFPPVFDICEMFARMEAQGYDFWGNTISPYSPDGSYIKEACIYEHLQSYFLVFDAKVVRSDVFWKFWEELPACREFIDVIAKCETKLTKILSDAGFSYAPYIRESYYISRFLNNYAVPYEKPCSLLLLKDAFVKKKCYQYMSAEEKVRLEFLLSQFKMD